MVLLDDGHAGEVLGMALVLPMVLVLVLLVCR